MERNTPPRYSTIEKRIGETPLEATERLRKQLSLSEETPLAYAGRLDPMAEGALLILIGDECKRQKEYHNLDKEYEFTVLFGLQSDTADVLGLVKAGKKQTIKEGQLRTAAHSFIGTIELPYPHFSAKTVKGKPLHVWTLEGRLNEIEIPTKKSHIYKLKLSKLETVKKDVLLERVHTKIDSVTPVTDVRKALGRDFRRKEVKEAWERIRENTELEYQLATFSCVASSGTYMRTLAEKIAECTNTCGLAFSIKRTAIGKYRPLIGNFGFFTERY